jgi:hypothetical protein
MLRPQHRAALDRRISSPALRTLPRLVSMPPELADELGRFPQPANNVLYIAGNNHEQIFPPKDGAKGERQRVEGVLKTFAYCSREEI